MADETTKAEPQAETSAPAKKTAAKKAAKKPAKKTAAKRTAKKKSEGQFRPVTASGLTSVPNDVLNPAFAGPTE